MAKKRVNDEKQQPLQVVAVMAFVDALSGMAYRPGDFVVEWPQERAEEYQRRGLVTIYGGPVIGPKEVK